MKADATPFYLALSLGIASLLVARGAAAQELAPPVAEAYRDRIIAAGELQALPADEDEPEQTSGLPRGFHVEVLASRNERGSDTYHEKGISIGGYRETASWGAFSLDATLFDSDRGREQAIDGSRNGLNGAATLWQRDLYVGQDWRVDNGLGVLNTPSTTLQRNQYRFYLPTVAFAGASSEWSNPRDGIVLQGSYGRAGIYNGTRLVGFELADGDTASLGAQWQWSPQWSAAASFLGTNGRIVPDDRGEAVLEQGDSQALYAATAWEGRRDRVQFNLQGSDSDLGSASGGWIDASSRRGRYTHNYGLFRLGTDLSWGALPINNDIEGGYYRLAYQYARWNWNAGIDRIASISGNGFDGTYATAFGRYQASSTLGYGANLNLRRSRGDSYSAQLFLDKQTSWGQTRLQADQAGADGRADSWQVSIDQAFPLQQGSHLSASLSYGELRYEDQQEATRAASVSLYGGRDLTDRLSLDGSARWTHGDGGSAVRGTDINLGLSWRASTRWLVSAAFYRSQGSQRSPFVLDPLVTETPFISLPRDRSFFLTLRYERNAGQPQAVLGGGSHGPSGSISGSVFLDENDDGRRSATELPASNVTVVLDGRYSVRTDSLGNFAFPRVSAGNHQVAVVPDNLPLPWSVEDARATQGIQVQVRQDVHIDIGARRQR